MPHKTNVNSNTGWQVLKVSGNWNNAGNAGLFYFNANNNSSNSNTNIGARQNTCANILRPGFPHLLVKIGFWRKSEFILIVGLVGWQPVSSKLPEDK